MLSSMKSLLKGDVETITAVISYHNDISGLVGLLSYLPLDMPVIIADDCSDKPVDALVDAIRHKHNTKLIRHSQNWGYVKSTWIAANQADSDIILLLNQDIKFQEPFQAKLLDTFNEHHEVGIVGCLSLTRTGRVHHAGIAFDADCQPYHRYFMFEDPSYGPVQTAGYVPAVNGAFFAIRREVWHNKDGYDWLYYKRAYFEDVDLCLRCAASGWKTWYEPSIEVIHVSDHSKKDFTWQSYNAMMFKRRWVDNELIVPDMLVRKEDFWPHEEDVERVYSA